MIRSPREIQELVRPQIVIEGAGVRLRRSFGPSRANPFDPFLLFDHFAFNDPIEGPIMGFPMHPHRGIETVTYMLEGHTRHRDSLGNMGLIGPGDVQWMTSGRGIMHEEMPRRGPSGRVDGFQLWVNLPAAEKMSRPRYQEIQSDMIPVVARDGVQLRVVAGQYEGAQGPVTEIAARPLYVDVSLEPATQFAMPVPQDHTAIAYLFDGEASFGPGSREQDERVLSVHLVVFGPGDGVRVQTGTDSHARFVLIAGAAFQEPIVPYGPFVMNTEGEIRQALADLRNGTFVQE